MCQLASNCLQAGVNRRVSRLNQADIVALRYRPQRRIALIYREGYARAGYSCSSPIARAKANSWAVSKNIFGHAISTSVLTLAATKVAARGVEERLFHEFFGNVWTIAAALPSDDSHPALLLAVDSDLRILGADGPRECYSARMMIVSIAVCLYQPSSTVIGLPFDATRYRMSQHASQVRMLRSGMY